MVASWPAGDCPLRVCCLYTRRRPALLRHYLQIRSRTWSRFPWPRMLPNHELEEKLPRQAPTTRCRPRRSAAMVTGRTRQRLSVSERPMPSSSRSTAMSTGSCGSGIPPRRLRPGTTSAIRSMTWSNLTAPGWLMRRRSGGLSAPHHWDQPATDGTGQILDPAPGRMMADRTAATCWSCWYGHPLRARRRSYASSDVTWEPRPTPNWKARHSQTWIHQPGYRRY